MYNSRDECHVEQPGQVGDRLSRPAAETEMHVQLCFLRHLSKQTMVVHKQPTTTTTCYFACSLRLAIVAARQSRMTERTTFITQ